MNQGKALTLLIIFLSTSSVHSALAEAKKFQFQRLGTSGATVAWAGVVVEVDGNSVKPRFVVQNRIFFSRWKNYDAYAIQACRKAQTPGSDSQNCLESKSISIEIPEGSTPYQYSYKFKYKKDGADQQEEFTLTEQRPDAPDTERIEWN